MIVDGVVTPVQEEELSVTLRAFYFPRSSSSLFRRHLELLVPNRPRDSLLFSSFSFFRSRYLWLLLCKFVLRVIILTVCEFLCVCCVFCFSKQSVQQVKSPAVEQDCRPFVKVESRQTHFVSCFFRYCDEPIARLHGQLNKRIE